MDFQKYNINEKEKKTKSQKYNIYIYEVCFKNSVVFFFKVIVDYNNENERSNRGVKHLKFFFNLKNDYSKNISRTFSGVVVDMVGSVHFQIVP